MDPDDKIRTRIAILRNGLSNLRNGEKKIQNYMRTTDRPYQLNSIHKNYWHNITKKV